MLSSCMLYELQELSTPFVSGRPLFDIRILKRLQQDVLFIDPDSNNMLSTLYLHCQYLIIAIVSVIDAEETGLVGLCD